VNYRVRFHPLVAHDLDAIARWILDYAGPDAAARKLVEIEAAIATLKTTPPREASAIKSPLACAPSLQAGKP
jgi:plasmid stabilization system protein ParE